MTSDLLKFMENVMKLDQMSDRGSNFVWDTCLRNGNHCSAVLRNTNHS